MTSLFDAVESLREIAPLMYGNGLQANETTKKEITEFYETYPAITWDNYLLEFFNTFLALNLYSEDESIIATIYGFDTNVTLSVLTPDEPLDEGDGFLRFAESLVKIQDRYRVGFNFAYDVTSERPCYVYFKYAIFGVDSLQIKYRPFANNFLEWLIQFRETKGLTLNSMFDNY